MEKEGNRSCHEVTGALSLQLPQEDPSSGSPCTCSTWWFLGSGAPTQGRWTTLTKAHLQRCPNAPLRQLCVQAGQSWKSQFPAPSLRVWGCLQGHRTVCRILDGGHTSTPPEVFPALPEVILQEQFPSRLCLQRWLGMTHIPSPASHPQL